MWEVKILTGPQAGECKTLQEGKNTVGRSEDNYIVLRSHGISKKHAHLWLEGDRVKLVDCASTNGVFVNGVKVKEHWLEEGDRFSFFDVLCSVQPKGTDIPLEHGVQAFAKASPQDQDDMIASGTHAGAEQALPVVGAFESWLDRAVMPGFYSLARMVDFRSFMAFGVAVFVLVLVGVSALPLWRLTSQGLKQQNLLKSQALAQALARHAAPLLKSGDFGAGLGDINLEPGVQGAYVVNTQGVVLAPLTEVGQPLDKPYVHEGRKKRKASAKSVSMHKAVGMAPIKFFDPVTQAQQTQAFAVVFYSSKGVLSMGDTLASFLVQNLVLYLLLGLLFWVWCCKMWERAFVGLSEQIEKSLKEGASQVTPDYKLKPLTVLGEQVQNLLARVLDAPAMADAADRTAPDRQAELDQLVDMVGHGAAVIQSGSNLLVAANEVFWHIVDLDPQDVLQSHVSSISDQALALNFEDIANKLSAEGGESSYAAGELDFKGVGYSLSAMRLYEGEESCYFLVILCAAEG